MEYLLFTQATVDSNNTIVTGKVLNRPRIETLRGAYPPEFLTRHNDKRKSELLSLVIIIIDEDFENIAYLFLL